MSQPTTMSPSKAPAPRQSLYEMTAEILALHQQRENAEYEGDSVEVERLDEALRVYLHEALPAKVDGIRGYIREQENAAAIHTEEAKLHAALAKRAEGNVSRVKAMCLEVMQHFGQRIYKGALHTIRRCGNGGDRPLVIRQPELVPEEMRLVTVKIPLDAWNKYADHLSDIGIDCQLLKDEPNNAEIRAALERGEHVAGCELTERAEHVRFS